MNLAEILRSDILAIDIGILIAKVDKFLGGGFIEGIKGGHSDVLFNLIANLGRFFAGGVERAVGQKELKIIVKDDWTLAGSKTPD